MKNLVQSVLPALLVMVLLSGCAAFAVAPVNGFLYSDVQAPMTATSNSGSSKMGEAECSSILGLVAQGDCSIETAAQNGGISQIHHVDYKSTNILGIYATFTVVVYGE
jgi:hypothetical protein